MHLKRFESTGLPEASNDFAAVSTVRPPRGSLVVVEELGGGPCRWRPYMDDIGRVFRRTHPAIGTYGTVAALQPPERRLPIPCLHRPSNVREGLNPKRRITLPFLAHLVAI